MIVLDIQITTFSILRSFHSRAMFTIWSPQWTINRNESCRRVWKNEGKGWETLQVTKNKERENREQQEERDLGLGKGRAKETEMMKGADQGVKLEVRREPDFSVSVFILQAPRSAFYAMPDSTPPPKVSWQCRVTPPACLSSQFSMM